MTFSEETKLRAEIEQVWMILRTERAAAVAKERELRMAVCAQAYQVVGSLLSDLGQFDTERATKILDNLSAGAVVHDVLPWPSFAQSNKDEPPSNEFYRIALNNISIRKGE
jgi:hypothetical protein